MKSKRIFLLPFLFLLCFLFCIQGCSNIFFVDAPKTSISIKFDLSSIVKGYRSVSNSRDLGGVEYVLKVVAYNGENYSANEKIENLPIFAQSSNKVNASGIVQTTLKVPIDSSVIFEAKLFTINTETKEESQDPLYYGQTEVINIKETDTKVSIVLEKIQLNEFLVQFNTLGGSIVDDQKVEENKTATAPASPTKTGYTFDGWYTSNDNGETLQAEFDFETPITSDIVLYAKWNQGTGTVYRVEHYQQNVEDDEYTFYEAEEKTGTTDTPTSSTAKNYEGFTAKEFEEQTILADGSTVVKIYYDRNTYTVSFDSKEGSPESYESETIKYQKTATEPISPTKTGYTFDGWYTSSDEGTTLQTKFDFETPITSDIVLYAKWIANKSIITITLPNTNDPEINLQQSTNGDEVTFTAKEGFESYAWYIDGEIQANATESTFIVDTSSMEAANYKVMIIVTDSDGNYYSATADLELKK